MTTPRDSFTYTVTQDASGYYALFDGDKPIGPYKTYADLVENMRTVKSEVENRAASLYRVTEVNQ